MRVQRLYLPVALSPGQSVPLAPDQAHRLTRVLRLRAGAPLRVFNGEGGEYDAELTREGTRWGIAAAGFVPGDLESPFHILLAQGVSRGERMDYTLQKAAELGVAEIQPLLTERSLFRATPRRAAGRRAHWWRVLVQACEQCGRTRIPALHPPVALQDWLEGSAAGVVLTPGAGDALAALEFARAGTSLLVGPEGGLSDQEVECALARGLRAAHLGPRVLRTESTALVALSILQARFGDLGSDPAAPRGGGMPD